MAEFLWAVSVINHKRLVYAAGKSCVNITKVVYCYTKIRSTITTQASAEPLAAISAHISSFCAQVPYIYNGDKLSLFVKPAMLYGQLVTRS